MRKRIKRLMVVLYGAVLLLLGSILFSSSYSPDLVYKGSSKLHENAAIHAGDSNDGVPLNLGILYSLENKMYPDLQKCSNIPLRAQNYHRGDYWVLQNYIPADMSFGCNESITFTTHADYTFLTNLDPVTARWQGPVSMSVYSPGEDFEATVATIMYLRECVSWEIRKLVTFHLIFHDAHAPREVPATEALLGRKIDCSSGPPHLTNVTTYRRRMKLLYPINLARNVARLASQTYFVFPADVELYPSVNFIPEFFKMLKKPDVSNTTDPRVFVLSIFEVKNNVKVPETKNELLPLLKTGEAIPFHKHLCPACHRIPKAKEWLDAPVEPGMSVFHVAKRTLPHQSWEPIYVGTNQEPLYDERLSWEGKSDKMTQMYVMCLDKYEFHVLDTAFLVHRPGIKTLSRDAFRNGVIASQNTLLNTKIKPEYRLIYGSGNNCSL
ncbi:beta-1,4-glucuronyltransferase 1 [Procambarus clarkii]|uniref:beta-1,4-glucuronyltransferase 1 n=1 Tax=Procambarus clarkii TaxID=6728 RepID=UPI001E670D03|nr:beta-1,4-glucuronyltransferase 1-like isoform X2 [Procambarus clarkii]